ncbi:MAG: LptF/LptG family permease [Candidatus Zixiibacteriota bacterium]
MKILNRYILREHIPPFVFSVFLITFLLILETIPRIVELVVDKDISIMVVLELIFLNLAWMIALSVPMGVLVATLLVFGRMTSDSEIVAIKASGINLLRVLIPLLIAAGFLTYGMIQFGDKILPKLNHRSRVLTGDIRTVRPTLSFSPGVFITDIKGYIILIDDIDYTTSEITGVRITDISNPNKPRITIAKSGIMEFIDNGNTMRLTLYDGESHMLDQREPENYQKVDFTNNVVYIAGVGSELKRSESSYRNDREMNIAQMNQTVENAYTAALPFYKRIDLTVDNKLDFLFGDSLKYPFDSTITNSAALVFLKNDMRTIYKKLDRDTQQINEQMKTVNKYNIEVYKKYSIPASSFAFVLIGAPLAILTRRGGMGLAVTISFILFTMYWGFLIGGEDLADRGMVSAFWAMWSANILTGGVGLYLFVKVISEKPIFSFFRK